VNEDFVREHLDDRNAIGRRFRFRDPSWREGEPMRMGPWYEIVGVVEQIAMTLDPEIESAPGFYLPLPESGVHPLRVAVHVGPDPQAFAPRVRELAAEVDQDMLLTDVRPLDDSAYQARVTYTTWFWVVLGAGGIGLLLATAGIYSIMAFTVARRTREIGIRVALGAGHRGIVWGVFQRALRQIAMGITGGAVLILMIGSWAMHAEVITPTAAHAPMFIAYLLIMSIVCGLACAVPTARALAVEPTEALRAEG
jgi:hypothetical protein